MSSSTSTRLFRLHYLAGAVAMLATSLRPVAAQIVAAPPTPPMAMPPLPTGLKVAHGSATLNHTTNAAGGSQLNIHTSAKAVLDWQQFSIGAGNGVHFQQPSPQSQVLNRVVGQDPSHILGNLSSNGKVWLINPNGVLFGQNARVDVGGLVASSLSLKLPDWLAGNPTLSAGNGGTNPGSVVNHGSIRTAFGGHIFLAAPVVANTGQLHAPGGQVALLGATSVELADTALPHMAFKVNAPSGSATQSGHISAHQIDVHASVINQQGLTQATSLGTDANGQVVLKATDTATIQGTISADNPAGQGGNIDITASRISVGQPAHLSASGSTQGGRIVLWGDAQTSVHGTLTARGGTGQGGFIETSTHGQLDITRAPDAGSTSGKPGTWLIDPHNITIQASGSDTNVNGGPPPASIGTTADSAIVTTGTITTALNLGTSVTIATSAAGLQAGDITVVSPISVTTLASGSTASLTLSAHNNININQPITASAGGGKLDLNLNANGGGGAGKTTIGASGSVNTNGGNIVSATNLSMNGGTVVAGALTGTGNVLASSGSSTLTVDAMGMGIEVAAYSTLNLGKGLDVSSPIAVNGGSLNVPAGQTLTASGGISSTGGSLGGGGTFVIPVLQTLLKTGTGDLGVGANTTVNNAGTLEWTDGSYGLNMSSTSVLNSTGVVQFSGATTSYLSPYGTFNLSGVLQNSGAGTLHVNNGTLNATSLAVTQSGTGGINLNPTTATYTGTTTLSGSNIAFNGGTHNINGPLTLSGAGTGLNVRAGTVNLSQGASYTQPISLTSGSTLNVPAGQTLTASGGMTTTGGVLRGGGTFVIPLGQTLTKTGFYALEVGANTTLSSAGTVDLVGSSNYGIILSSTGAVFNSTGTLRYGGSVNYTGLYSSNYNAGTFNLSGALENTGSGTISFFGGALNTTDLNVTQSGTGGFSITSPVATYSGTTTLNGGNLTFSGGVHHINGPLAFAGTTALNFSGGTVNLSQGASYTQPVNLTGGTLNVPAGQTLTASGGMTSTGGTLGGGGSFVIPAGQTLSKTGAVSLYVGANTTLNSAGTIDLADSASTSVASPAKCRRGRV